MSFGIDREALESMALKTVSAANYYDLADNIDTMTNADLYFIINCYGVEEEEDAYGQAQLV